MRKVGTAAVRRPAREILTVINGGEFRPGLSFYGLGRPGLHQPRFPQEVWPEETEYHVSRLHGDAWQVMVWDVALLRWPYGEEWWRALHATLAAFIDMCYLVAWVGGEGYFCDPPDLFDPSCMSGGVLAAVTKEYDFTRTLDPNAPLRPLSDEQMLQLRQSAEGLADAV